MAALNAVALNCRGTAVSTEAFCLLLFMPCFPALHRYGPQPAELGGQRALDFVLDNPTLQDFNRTLLFDIKLLTVRRARQ